MIRALRYWRKKHPRSPIIARELGYFRRYRHRMQYADWAAHRLPIGSGVVEAACKTLVTERLKRSGMRWTHRGGQAILTFRTWLQSGLFDQAWSKLAITYVNPVLPPAQIIPFPKAPRPRAAEGAI